MSSGPQNRARYNRHLKRHGCNTLFIYEVMMSVTLQLQIAYCLLASIFMPVMPQSPCDGSPCPCSTISNTSKVMVNCSHMNFTHVPQGLPKSTVVLDLSHNHLQPNSLSSVCEHYNIQTLLLSWNSLSHLPDHVFSKCLAFQSLDLSGNHLDNVSSQTLVGLTVSRLVGLESVRFQNDTFKNQIKLHHLDIRIQQQDIPSDLFSGLNLQVLNISVKQVINLSPLVFRDSRSSLTELRIEGYYFHDIDSRFLEGFHQLLIFELHVEMFTSFQMSIFQNTPALKRIKLSDIKKISTSKSDNFTLENVLEICINKADSIPDDIFSNVPRLVDLDLSYSTVMFVPEHWFKNETSIKHLNLSRMDLSSIHQHHFTHLQKLETFDMSYNILRSLEGELFHHTSNHIRDINLSGNLLTELVGNIFSNCSQLERLDLSENQISLIDSDVFGQLNGLRHLSLRDNKLSQLAKGIFINTVQLVHVDLSSNVLTGEHLQELYHLSQLENLDLSNNRIASVPGSIFTIVPSLTALDLRFNPIDCHCELAHTLTLYETQLRVSATCKIVLRDQDIKEFLEQANCFVSNDKIDATNVSIVTQAIPVPVIVPSDENEDNSSFESVTEDYTSSLTRELVPSTSATQPPVTPSAGTILPDLQPADGEQSDIIPVLTTPHAASTPGNDVVNVTDVMADDNVLDNTTTSYNATDFVPSGNFTGPAYMVTTLATTDKFGTGYYTAVAFITSIALICVLTIAFLVWRKRRQGERYEVTNDGTRAENYTSLYRDRSPISSKASLGILKEVPSIQIETVDDDDNVHVIKYSTPNSGVRHPTETVNGL